MALNDQQKAEVYQNAFFTKLAEAGISVQDEDTAQGLLSLATKTRKLAAAEARHVSADVAGNVKTANAYLDRIFNGDAAYDQLIKAHGKVAQDAPKAPAAK